MDERLIDVVFRTVALGSISSLIFSGLEKLQQLGVQPSERLEALCNIVFPIKDTPTKLL